MNAFDRLVYSLYTQINMKNTLKATEARKSFFKMLDSVIYRGEEFIIEKKGQPAAKISPLVNKKTPEEITKTLTEVRAVFAKSKKRSYWSVIDTPTWKEKESKYTEKLSKGLLTMFTALLPGWTLS